MKIYKLSIGAMRHLQAIAGNKTLGDDVPGLDKLSSTLKILNPLLNDKDYLVKDMTQLTKNFMGEVMSTTPFTNFPRFIALVSLRVLAVERYLNEFDNKFLFIEFNDDLAKFIREKLIDKARKEKHKTNQGDWIVGEMGKTSPQYMELYKSFRNPIKPEELKNIPVTESHAPDATLSAQQLIRTFMAGAMDDTYKPTIDNYDPNENIIDDRSEDQKAIDEAKAKKAVEVNDEGKTIDEEIQEKANEPVTKKMTRKEQSEHDKQVVADKKAAKKSKKK